MHISVKPVEVCLLEPKSDVVLGTPVSFPCWAVLVSSVRPSTHLAARAVLERGLDPRGKREWGCHLGTDPVSLLHAAQKVML